MKQLFLTLLFTSASFAQTVAAKAEPSKPTAPQAAVTLSTAKYWRLVSEATSAHKVADETPQARAAADADAQVQAEIQQMAKDCGQSFSLSIDQDKNSPTYKDVICVKAPEAPKPVEAKK